MSGCQVLKVPGWKKKQDNEKQPTALGTQLVGISKAPY